MNSEYGLLSADTKPIPKPMLTSHYWSPVAFTWEQFPMQVPQSLLCKIGFRIILLKLRPHSIGANEFISECMKNTPCYANNSVGHDDVTKWKHFPRYWPFVRGIHRGFPTQRPVTRSFYVCFDWRLNKRLSKQSWGWWFGTPSRPLWRHNNDILICWWLPLITQIKIISS